MRKHHLALSLSGALALCALDATALAKPQPGTRQERAAPTHLALRPPSFGLPPSASARRNQRVFQLEAWSKTPALAARAGLLTAKLRLPAERFALTPPPTSGRERAGLLSQRLRITPRMELGEGYETKAAPDGEVELSAQGVPVVAARSRAGRDRAEPLPCLKKPVLVSRQLGDEVEHDELSLTYCDGKVHLAALDALSALARSRHVARPLSAEIKAYQRLPLDRVASERRRDPAYLTSQIMRLHPGLLERLQKVVERFPNHPLEVVSGHRPDARYTSRHHHGRALDFRVQGITRERLRDFLRTLDETGVGYYPNSSFVHMDVRDDKGYWVDRSGPGERADYGVWPPPKREIEQAQARILQGALADLAQLAPNAFKTTPNGRAASPTHYADRSAQALPSHPHGAEPREESDHMNAREVAKIRAEALKALAELR
jgi:uncharacterized protein YcbK (DUF882 family)